MDLLRLRAQRKIVWHQFCVVGYPITKHENSHHLRQKNPNQPNKKKTKNTPQKNPSKQKPFYP